MDPAGGSTPLETRPVVHPTFLDLATPLCKISISNYKMLRLFAGAVAVCAESYGDVHAGQVPAGLHVPTQRADAPCPPLHRHPALLSHRPLRHQGTRNGLHHLSSHGEHQCGFVGKVSEGGG